MESMMSGGVCCAESDRRDIDPYCDNRSRICLLQGAESLSGKNALSEIYFQFDQRRDRLYACSTAVNIYRGGKTSEKTIPYMAS